MSISDEEMNIVKKMKTIEVGDIQRLIEGELIYDNEHLISILTEYSAEKLKEMDYYENL